MPCLSAGRSADRHLGVCVMELRSMLPATRAWAVQTFLQPCPPRVRVQWAPQGVSPVLERQRIAARRGDITYVVVFDHEEAVRLFEASCLQLVLHQLYKDGAGDAHCQKIFLALFTFLINVSKL